MPCSEENCCEIPVCLKFVCVSATEEFKEQMAELFSEIFENLCSGDEPAACCPDTPVIDGKVEMCLNDVTISVNKNACEGILQAGGTCGACPIPEPPE